MNTLLINSAEGLNNYIKHQQDELDLFNKNLQLYREFVDTKTNKLNSVLPDIQSELKKFGFEISSIQSLRKTGIDGSYKDLKDTDSLKVSCYLKMIGRRKPINLSTYSRSGDAKNGPKVRQLAGDVSDAIKVKLNIGCSLNYFSLSKSEGILFDMWI